MYAVYHGEFIRNVRRSGYKVVLFPDPTNPSADRFQYCVRGGGLVTFVMFCVLCMNLCRASSIADSHTTACNYMTSRYLGHA